MIQEGSDPAGANSRTMVKTNSDRETAVTRIFTSACIPVRSGTRPQPFMRSAAPRSMA